MTTALIISALTAVAMVTAVLVKPYVAVGKIKIGLYWVACLIGALLILAFGVISPVKAWEGITADSEVNPLKILALFLSMTILSIYLGDAGFFDLIADKIFLKAKGGQLKLFLILYAVVAVLTVFTSNDIIILTFTPPICVFASRAKISPLPYLFGEFIAANTWSMMLIVGNPTNIYLASSGGIGFAQYFSVMWLPAIAGGLAGLLALLIAFGKRLNKPIDRGRMDFVPGRHKIVVETVPMIVAIAHLLVCIALLAFSYTLKVEMWVICVALAVSLTLFNAVYGIIKQKSVKRVVNGLKKAPYELIPFVLSMFVIVLALSECGFTSMISDAIISGTKADGISFGFISAIASNVLNNIPMSVLFEKIIAGSSTSALFGAIIGSNVGAFITPVGALAGIMWTKILGSYDVKLSFGKFMLYGVCTAIPSIVASTAVLWLII